MKVDFAHYPHKRIEKGKVINQVDVDSLLDIAVNKLLSVIQRREVKDFVDLYFLLKTFTIWDLLRGIEVKFSFETEPFLIADDFIEVEQFTSLPRMIKPLTLSELKVFFRERAIEVGKKMVE